MGVFFSQASSPTCYHPPLLRREIQKSTTLYDQSLVYSKYLNLLRLPFRTLSVALDLAKILPIGDDARAVIAVQDQFIRLFNSTLNLPRFFISQIGFYNASSKLIEELSGQETGRLGKLSARVSEVFFSTLTVALSSIKVLQLGEKFNLLQLAKVSARLPVLFAKSSNIFILILVGRGLFNSIVLLNDQVKADYSSRTWAEDGLSPRTKKTISSVVSRSLGLIYVSTTTASLYFGIYTNPILLMGISATSHFINLSYNMDTYKKMIWETTPAPIIDATSFLPA